MYATRDDMIAEFGESEVIALTDRGGLGVIDDDVLARGLERATSEIDGYIAGRFQPGVATPPALVGICCDIARYRLCGTTQRQMTEEIAERYKTGVDFLQRAAKGQVTLGTPAGNDPGTANSVQILSGGATVFGRGRGGF